MHVIVLPFIVPVAHVILPDVVILPADMFPLVVDILPVEDVMSPITFIVPDI